jgi:signal recognition particle GTPase
VFDKLSARLASVVEGLRGRGRLTEENISDTLRQVRMALLEADVALPVVKTFIEGVKAQVVGQEIHKSLTPGQALIKVIHDELVRVMGEGVRPLNLRAQPPAIVLLAGLQGAGKTTTAAMISSSAAMPRRPGFSAITSAVMAIVSETRARVSPSESAAPGARWRSCISAIAWTSTPTLAIATAAIRPPRP